MDINKYLNQKGYLKVSNGHKLYWEDWGNKEAKTPIFFLHGGPGAGFGDGHKFGFDPRKQRVIFHDQRGAGRSKPFASLKNNTTQDLANDINVLADHLNIELFSIHGGSWGSTLGLVYAIHNPERVTRMLLRGIFLGNKDHIDFVSQGGGRMHYPEVWQRYQEQVPPEHLSDTAAYYANQFSDSNKRAHYVREWVRLETALMQFDNQLDKVNLDLKVLTEKDMAIAQLEAHYFINKCFLPPNFILDNTAKIAHIPTVIVQGRYDFVCPPEGAFDLANKLGDNCNLHFIPAGHKGSDPVMFDVLKAYSRAFL